MAGVRLQLKSLFTMLVSLGMLQVQQVVVTMAACTYIHNSTQIEPDICLNLTEALELVNRDNLQLLFDPGMHILQNSSTAVISNLTGLGFTGQAEDPAAVRIMCQDNVGLVFLRSSQLRIENLSLIGCSLDHSQGVITRVFSERTYEEVINVPNALSAGLLISDSSDVVVNNVIISDTKGIGLVGLNLLGESIISHVLFKSNRPHIRKCPELTNIFAEPDSKLIGGGLYVLYQDYKQRSITAAYTLTITGCEFHGNEDCSDVWVPELFQNLNTRLEYSVGGGGGLTVMNAHSQYTVSTSIHNSSFVGNTAKFGGGAHVGFFAGAGNNVVNFCGCSFSSNGKVKQPYSGGGLSVLVDIARPTHANTDKKVSNNSLMAITNTHFNQNSAYVGGGLFVLMLSNTINQQERFTIQGCTFRRNKAPLVSALLVFTRRASVLESEFFLVISDTLFENNNSEFDVGGGNGQIAGVSTFIRGGRLTLAGNTGFYSNIGTALTCAATHTYIEGNITIAKTVAFSGSLRLVELSTVTMRQNSVLRFSRNSAAPYGGAILVGSQNSQVSYSQSGCFLYFQEVDLLPQAESCPDFGRLNVTIVFDENRAEVGTNIYGSTLENCNWAHCLRNSTRKAVLEILEDMNIIRILGRNKFPLALEVSTPSSKLELLNYTEEHVMPGETFFVNILALDELNQSIFSGLGAVVSAPSETEIDSSARARLGPNGFWFIDRSPNFEGSRTPVSVKGTENQKLSVLIGALEDGTSAFDRLNVTLTSCLLGFRYDTLSQTCLCETGFSEVGVECDSNTAIITLPDRVWLGPVEADNRTLFGYTLCSINYCRPGPFNITKENFDSRCFVGTNREGVGCGQCGTNFSTTFGTGVCMECSNYYLFLIIVFLLAGVGTMFLMALLRITVSEGYLYSVLFYSNVVNSFAVFLTPSLIHSGTLIPLSWISQNLGIRTCFFDGMTTLHAYALRFAYVAYLSVLMILVAVLARFVQIPRSYIYSPVKVLATLLILCYSSLLETCVSIFAFTFVYTNDGQRLVRWFYDANVVYFEGLHAFLFILALLIMVVFVMPFPILTLSPRLVLRQKTLSQLKPLLDPYWASLKPNYEWWVSFRLLFRWIPVFISAFVSVPQNFLILGICVLCLLFLQMKLQPFKGSLRNALDDILVANIVLLVIGFFYFFCLTDESGITAYSGVLVALAYVVFVFSFMAQVNLHHPDLKKRLAKWIQRRILKKEPVSDENEEAQGNGSSPSNVVTHSEVVVSPRHQSRESVRFATPDASDELSNLKYTRYRESLLADQDEEHPRGFLETLGAIPTETSV